MAVTLAELNDAMTAVWAAYLESHREEGNDMLWYVMTGSALFETVCTDPDLEMDEGL